MKRASSPVLYFKDLVAQDITGPGRFRPVYWLWVLSMYTWFEHAPLTMYLAMAFLNMGALAAWGLVFYEFFAVPRKYFFSTVFIFPLSFFLFTPFWNAFMYFSPQEKFVVFFAPLSLYFFKKSYDRPGLRHGLYCFVLTVLAMFGKEPAIFLPLIYVVFAGYNVVKGYKKNIALVQVGVYGALAGFYVWLTTQILFKGNYASTYSGSLKVNLLKDKILATPIVIKVLFAVAIGLCLYELVKSLAKKTPLGFPVLLYLSLFAYLGVLLPWGYDSYYLCALAPFVLTLFFPAYLYAQQRGALTARASHGALIVALAIVFCGIIVPRVSEMKDIANIIGFLRLDPPQSKKYFLPVYQEWTINLTGFTGQNVAFIEREQLERGALDPKEKNFLLLNHLCPRARLENIASGGEVYANANWKVIALQPKNGHMEHYQAEFPENLIQRIKSRIRDLH